MSIQHRTIPSSDIYGPGTFVDAQFLDVPNDARRVFEILAQATPGFTQDRSRWESVVFEGHPEPIIPGPIKAPVVAAALHAMCGVVANEILEQRDGQPDRENLVTVNTDHAAIWLGSVFAVKVNGKDIPEMMESGGLGNLFRRDFENGVFSSSLNLRTTALYPTRTPGVWYQLHGSLNPEPVLRAIGVDPHLPCESPRAAYTLISEHVRKLSADELEMLNVKNGFCGSICYTPEEWKQTMMGKALARHPLVNYTQESYAIPTPPVPLPILPADKRPLAGIKVVELVRIIAGPVVGSTLAALGADVIRVNCSRLRDLNALQLSLNAGIRTCDLDLTVDEDIARLKELLLDADIFVQGFRPGTIARKGFSLHDMLEMAGRRGKGIIYVDENCYGPDGPFHERPGWQQVGDAASGSSYVTGKSLGHTDGTSVLPPLPISDMLTGLIGALGALLAVRDRASRGGSYHVVSSLVAADTVSLQPEIGLYSPEVVRKNADKFGWDTMDSSLYVTELLIIMLKGWKRVFPEYFDTGSPLMTTLKGDWGEFDLIKPVVGLGHSDVTPRWLTAPVPHCHYSRNISWLEAEEKHR